MVPMIFVRPHLGAMLWAWTAMLVPNALLHGFGQSLRYNLVIAAATLVAWFLSKEPKKVEFNLTYLFLFLFLVWTSLATAFGVAPEEVRWRELTELIKIIIFTVVVGGLITTRLRIYTLLFGLCLGMGFHGAVEGLKFIVTGGSHHIFGPGTSIISDNNAFALAMVFLLPFVYYLFSYSAKLVVRCALGLAFFLIFVSVIGTFSRGGLIGLAAVGFYALFQTRQKFLIILGLCVGGFAVVFLAPEHWFGRMETILEADKDSSFMLRVIAWKVSILLALDHPLLGGGLYAIQDAQTWYYYSTQFDRLDFIPTPPIDPYVERAAHSIYFQVLGDSGFVGLAIFLAILLRSWISSGRLIRRTKEVESLEWIRNLSHCIRLSLFGYAVAGAALNMAYFEMMYVVVVLIAIQERLVRQYFQTTDLTSRKAAGDLRPKPQSVTQDHASTVPAGRKI